MELQNLVTLLEKQNVSKKDFIAPSQSIIFEKGILTLEDSKVTYNPTDIFHSQVAEKLSIPKQYYDRLRIKAVNLLDENVNHWLSNLNKKLLVRTFEKLDNDYVARALLSNGYSVLDNYDVLFETLEAIQKSGLDVEITQADISESRMYLRVICPSIEIKAKEMLKDYKRAAGVDYGVISGFVLTNSEVGHGSFNIMPRAVVKVCNNGLVIEKDSLKRVHLGGKMDELDYSKNEAVKAANMKLIKEQVKHAVKVFLSKQYLTNLVNVYSALGEPEIVAPVSNVIEVVAKNYQLGEDRKNNILQHFIKQGDQRRIGLVNAITEECQGLKDVDAKHDSEVMSYDILRNFSKIEASAFNKRFSSN